MQRSFFRSKHFAIALVAALLIVGTAAAFYATNGVTRWTTSHDACRDRTPAGQLLSATNHTQDEGRTRIVTYVLNASSFEGGTIDLCTSIGDILVTPAAGDDVELVFHIQSRHAEATANTQVRAAFADDGGRLAIAGWEAVHGAAGGVVGSAGASVQVTLRVPATGAYAADLVTAVGDIRVQELLLGPTSLRSDVGDVGIYGADATGNLTLQSDVGDVWLEPASVQTGAIRLSSDTGEVEARLPQRADIGYDVRASSDVGSVTVDIGETEHRVENRQNVGGDVEARSKGYAEKPTQVTIRAESDVGDVRVVTQ